MAHNAQHARKRTSRYSNTTKVLVMLLVLLVGVIAVWVASIHGGDATSGIVAHGLNPVIPFHTHPVIPKAAHMAAGGAVGGAIAGGVKKVAAKHIARHYIVRPGDTLWGIAQKTLHNPLKWHRIYALNHGLIGADPNKIVAGQSLLL